MLSLLRRSLGFGLRIIIAVACCLAIWNSWEFAHADYLFQKDTEDSVRAAIRLVPDSWEYYMRLAQFDRGHTRELLSTSLRLNRYDAQADIELGLQYETEGDFARAEKLLLDAYDVDHTYLPRWTLANFYFRRDNTPAFWAWAHNAAEMPASDIGPLFELCWRVSPDPGGIAGVLLNEKSEVTRQYLIFLLAKGQLQAVADVAPRLIRSGEPETDRPLLFDVVNRLVIANDGVAANALWHSLIKEHWVVADATVPNNAVFAREPLPISFDWSLPEYPGLHSWPGASGLETEFSGSQPEECTIAEQAVVLAPGNYSLAYTYRTTDIPSKTGIRWQIIDAQSNTVLASSPDLSSDASIQAAVTFSVPPGASLLRLRLVYRRALGTPRISGTLVVISTQIRAHSQS
jgi:tetratricopeptide (TPR) repeat protein